MDAEQDRRAVLLCRGCLDPATISRDAFQKSGRRLSKGMAAVIGDVVEDISDHLLPTGLSFEDFEVYLQL